MNEFYKLFVVTNSPLVGDLTNGTNKLCLVMKRQGLLVQYNEAGIMVHTYCDVMEPLISGNTPLSWKRSAKMEASSKLKSLIIHTDRDMLDADIIEFDIKKKLDTPHCQIFGVMVPNIVYNISHSPLFGVIDLLSHDMMSEEMEFQRKMMTKKSPTLNVSEFVKTMKNKQRGTTNKRSPDISADDLSVGYIVLNHFQVIADKEYRRRVNKLQHIKYASAK